MAGRAAGREAALAAADSVSVVAAQLAAKEEVVTMVVREALAAGLVARMAEAGAEGCLQASVAVERAAQVVVAWVGWQEAAGAVG